MEGVGRVEEGREKKGKEERKEKRRREEGQAVELLNSKMLKHLGMED